MRAWYQFDAEQCDLMCEGKFAGYSQNIPYLLETQSNYMVAAFARAMGKEK